MSKRVSLIADPSAGEPVSFGSSLVAGKKVAADVTHLLAQDHREALAYFDWYEAASDRATKVAVARRLCAALQAHMRAEEEIFYPEVRQSTGDDSLLDQAIEEHREAKDVMARIVDAPVPVDDDVRALRDAIEDHIAQEEETLFPEVRQSKMDLYAAGRAVAARKVAALHDILGKTHDKAGAGAAHFMETPMIPISEDAARPLYLAGLRDIHATAKQGRTMLDKQLSRLEKYPEVEVRLRAHLQEKDAQIERVEEILESMGESRSALKDIAMSTAGNVTAMMAAVNDDEILKNSIALYGLANFEAASYESLIFLGQAAGQTPSDLRKLQTSLNEERAMASWLGGNLRGVHASYLQMRSAGQQASH